jgi:thiamine-monophosphate kinase
MNELELIERLTAGLPRNASTRVGCGDDCAVLDFGGMDSWILFKTDAVVSGVHFDSVAAPEAVGHKALGRCLSDIAAMGGWPTHALVTIGLPVPFDVEWVQRVYRGMQAMAAEYDVAIVGGETTASPGAMFLSLAVMGTVPRDRCLLRSGARPGDAILVTGDLGGSLVSGRHLTFQPRLAEARWLATHFEVHAMIDLSDGLAGDLRQVLKASGVGAELLASAIPISAAARKAGGGVGGGERMGAQGKTALERALTDGEDFELLFTMPASDVVRLTDTWRGQFGGLKVGCIGRIIEGCGLHLRGVGFNRSLDLDGYVHFQGT